MSVARYNEYKDSGVAWLGEVPDHWRVVQGRRLFTQKREPAQSNDEQLSATQKYGVIPQHLFMELEDQKLTLALRGLDNFKHVEENDFVISLRSFQGGIERSLYVGCVSPAYTVIVATEPVDPVYWSFLMKSQNFIAALQTVTDSIREGKSINYEQFGHVGLPVPPIFEQKAISTFLDRETAKIDALVEEQEKLIALLKEKRQAVISHAVTKGIDPSVPMKDSGIEWLGEVPEHWAITPLRYIGKAIIGLTYRPDDVVAEGEGVLVLRSSNIQGGKITFNDNVYVNMPIPDGLVTKAGDILICSRNGSRDLIGKNALIENESVGLSFGAFTVVYRTPHSKFVYYVLNSQLFKFQAGRFLTTTINQLTTGTLNAFKISLPSEDEQESITKYLDTKIAEIDKLVQYSEQAIHLLAERRGALISAVVTGKIDVRGLVAEEVNA